MRARGRNFLGPCTLLYCFVFLVRLRVLFASVRCRTADKTKRTSPTKQARYTCIIKLLRVRFDDSTTTAAPTKGRRRDSSVRLFLNNYPRQPPVRGTETINFEISLCQSDCARPRATRYTSKLSSCFFFSTQDNIYNYLVRFPVIPKFCHRYCYVIKQL